MIKAKRYRRPVEAALTQEFLRGGPRPDLSSFLDDAPEEAGRDTDYPEVDVDLIRELMTKSVVRDPSLAGLDSWLAPRLHFTLRIERRLAGDRGFWAWLAINACEDYLHARWHDSEGLVSAWRYTGNILRNGIARLWWGAEMARNGPQYGTVESLFNRVRTAQFALELRYSWYRPAVIAFVNVAEGLDGGAELKDPEMKDLSKRINSYLSLLALESLGPNFDENETPDLDWRARSPTLTETLDTETFLGPQDGYASDQSVAELTRWFRYLSDSAPAVLADDAAQETVI